MQKDGSASGRRGEEAFLGGRERKEGREGRREGGKEGEKVSLSNR